MTTSRTDPCPTPAARKAAPFSNRAAAVFLAGLIFGLLALSGLVVAFAPSGRIAADTDWSLFWLGRAQWESLHLTLGVAFIGAAGWHIWLHWPVITNLLWSAAAHTLCHRRELVLALAVVGLLAMAAVLSLPPASWLSALSGGFKRGSW